MNNSDDFGPIVKSVSNVEVFNVRLTHSVMEDVIRDAVKEQFGIHMPNYFMSSLDIISVIPEITVQVVAKNQEREKEDAK